MIVTKNDMGLITVYKDRETFELLSCYNEKVIEMDSDRFLVIKHRTIKNSRYYD